MPSPVRILTAVPICDGHDSAINTINLEFIRHGIEVIYLGYHRSVGDIVRAASENTANASAPLPTLSRMVPTTPRVTSRRMSWRMDLIIEV